MESRLIVEKKQIGLGSIEMGDSEVVSSAHVFGESDVGIIGYLNDGTKEIKCVTKYRIADFIVNEVTLSKEVLYPL